MIEIVHIVATLGCRGPGVVSLVVAGNRATAVASNRQPGGFTVRPLNIPVVLGTARHQRASVHVARFIADALQQRAGVVTELIDIARLPLPTDDAGEAIKDPGFAAAMAAADALVIVAPEYNHSFPGLLKHVLDSCLSEYVHKAAGIVGVSAGPFAGTRVVQNLLPVLRELGLVTIFWDINVGAVATVFGEDGRLLDSAFERRSDKFVRELLWMAKTLRHGRECTSIDEEAVRLACPQCGGATVHHADKADPAAGEAVMLTLHSCPTCGVQHGNRAPRA